MEPQDSANTLDKRQRFQVNRVRYLSTDENKEPQTLTPPQEEGDLSPLDADHRLGVNDTDKGRHGSGISNSDTHTDRRFDTHNLKTFGKDTHERIPHIDFYRASASVTDQKQAKRPTLVQLIEQDQEVDDLKPSDTAPLVSTQDDPGVVKPKSTKFGWILGVLVRCLLNIWGVMLFMRLSWVVGQAGIGLGSMIIVLSCVVTTITALSMSAICTNGDVKAGGAYYMISRALGPEFGGAIGIIFSLANAVAVSMYVVGFAETVRDLLKVVRMMKFFGVDLAEDVDGDLILSQLMAKLTEFTKCDHSYFNLCLPHMTSTFQQDPVHSIQDLTSSLFNIGLHRLLIMSITKQPKIQSDKLLGSLMEADRLIIDEHNDVRLIGVVTVTGLLAIAIIGMEWEARAQGVLLIILLIAIADFVLGVFSPVFQPAEELRGFVGLYTGKSPFFDNFGPSFSKNENFFSVFAIFFPAATGILAGANISGDLKNPSTAIPKGTLLAILLTGISYLACIWFLGAVVSRASDGTGGVCEDIASCQFGLLYSYRVMELVSLFGPIIIAGIFAATLSSGLASLVSAPKVFQAVCSDGIFPYIQVFAKGYGPSNEPRKAYILTYFIAVGFICIGDLNAIAPLISNFFLMAYTLINYSCFDASLSKTPGWRPSFKFYSMYVALFGAMLCFIIMFLIKWWAALITLAFVAILYGYVHYKKPDINWGSSTQAHVYKASLNSALKLLSTKDHVKNFRPQILVLSGTPRTRPALVDFANNITKGVSLLVCGHVIMSDSHVVQHPKKITRIYDVMLKRRVKGFYEYVTSQSFRDGAFQLIETSGLGKLRPNTVLMGFKNNWLKTSYSETCGYVNVINDAFGSKYGVGILRTRKGFDVTGFLSEADLLLMSHSKGRFGGVRKPQTQNAPSSLRTTASTTNEENDTVLDEQTNGDPPMEGEETEETELDEFDQDEVVINTIYGNNRLKAEVLPEVNRFHLRQRKGTIDVWWLFDDGGLTLLIPQILSTKPYWQDCKLRVFLVGTKKGQLSHEQKSMATMLSKFRIDYSDMEVIPTFGKEPSQESKKMFNQTLTSLASLKDHSDNVISEEALESNHDRTNRHLRTRDLVLEKSESAALIVITLPVPRKGQPEGLYMAWIDCLSRDLPSPVLLLRGNQQNVLTFYS